MSEIKINIETVHPIEFLGNNHSRLKIIKEAFPTLRIAMRGDKIIALGDDEHLQVFEQKIMNIIELYEQLGSISDRQVEEMMKGETSISSEVSIKKSDILVYGNYGKNIKAKTKNQKKLVELSEKNDILFAIGPAGTGKTYTAVALAVRALKNKWVNKIILARPAVEAGESLGFLPGDLKEKVDPYLRPLYDALDDMIRPEKLAYYMTNRIIEIAPLAYMRGRTLDNAFIILDEAQNTTMPQLKMFLTRIGANARCIITGDLTQIDLPKNQQSGLFKTTEILKNIKGIKTVQLDKNDVARHRLVKDIIEAFEKEGKKEEK
ncbi:MAG: PhoH family protein [Chitinophagales bacterium]|nr:PhoH family protein [Chitinophagales bacterium]